MAAKQKRDMSRILGAVDNIQTETATVQNIKSDAKNKTPEPQAKSEPISEPQATPATKTESKAKPKSSKAVDMRQVNLKLPKDLVRKIKQVALDEDKTMASLIQSALEAKYN